MSTAQREIPSRLDLLFENINKTCTEAEADMFMSDLKKRHSRSSVFQGNNLHGTLKDLYHSGTIDENDVTLLELITVESGMGMQNKESLSSLIQDYESKLQSSEGEKLIGRERDMDTVVQYLSEPGIHGISCVGPPGVGKTALSKEVAKLKVIQQESTFLFELKGITKMSDLYLYLLCEFNLTCIPRKELEKHKGQSKSYDTSITDKKIIISFLEQLDAKTLLILDNIEEKLIRSAKDEFVQFINSVINSKVVQDGKLKFILIFTGDHVPFDSVKFQSIDPLTEETSRGLLSKRLNVDSLDEKENQALTKLAEYCRCNSYLLQGAEQMMRECFCSPVDILEKIESQIKKGVAEKYACIGAQFESISRNHLKELAVKIALITGPFSVKTVMKIAEVSTALVALIDLELLCKHKLVAKVEGEKKCEKKEKTKYEVHSLFQDFVTSSLIKTHGDPFYQEVYKRAEQRFAWHFLDKMNALVETIETDFLETFKKFEKNKVNLDMTLELASTNKGIMERLLPSEDHGYRLVVLLESLKDLKERRELFKTWAEAFQREGKWLESAIMRCWQSIQLADMEGTTDSEIILELAKSSFEQAEQASDPDQLAELESGRALIFLCSGKISYMKSANFDKSKKERKQELTKKGLRDLDGALAIYRKLYGDHNMTVRTLNIQGNCFMELDDPDQAETAYQEALDMKIKLTGSEKHSDIAMFYNQLSQVHEKSGIKEEKRWYNSIPGFMKVPKEKYEKAVYWLKKALELDKQLNLNNTLSSATFNRNLANVLIGLQRYDEALVYAEESYRTRKKLLGEHPETVRILYLIGVIHEWKKEFQAALTSFEEAFKMEESLPSDNHSVVRVKLCVELKRMCDKCKDKEMPREYSLRLKQLRELPEASDQLSSRLPDETTRKEALIKESSETKVSVDEHGGIYNLESHGIFLNVPPGALNNKTELKIKLLSKDSLPSPAGDMVAVVSFIVELGPSDVVLHKAIAVGMLHSGCVGTSYYENIVMAFNETTRTWEEIPEFHFAQASHPPSYCPAGTIQVQITKLTTLAVISRLTTDSFEVPASGCSVTSSACPDIRLDFPEGAVHGNVKGNLKVMPMPDVIPTDFHACPSPIVVVDGFEHVKLLRSVKLTLPHPCPAKYPSCELHIMYLESKDWKDITHDICHTEHEKTIELQIRHFSAIWLLIGAVSAFPVLFGLYKVLSAVPKTVCFTAYKLKKMDACSGYMKLTLVCCEGNTKMAKDKEERFGENYDELAQDTGKQMRPNQVAYTKVIGTFETSKDIELQFLDQLICVKELDINKKENVDRDQQVPEIVITFSSSESSTELGRLTVHESQLINEIRNERLLKNTATAALETLEKLINSHNL